MAIAGKRYAGGLVDLATNQISREIGVGDPLPQLLPALGPGRGHRALGGAGDLAPA